MGRLRYKGYVGSVEYAEEDNCFYGKVLGLRRDGIVYEGDTANSLKKDFEDAIDHYLESCKQNGITPEKPYSGKLVLRMTPELHSIIAEKASDKGESINDFINLAIKEALSLSLV
ncbi:MAG: type II toxin-antitoxin system HicB family antitoxin [Bacteroidales bacterium]|jgi:predicted HicB family RNase H-like nuclease|nr:type II toxin-antitoxin system HicB family antitoxin [Bacteroidales bacterium]MBQ1841453.1 type II toxin-antitoxin system HicB family antitoxin [Bacteroidales bacterium]MBQ3846809.1 type II toxin-antitoxin system HicB family antitoxin [Bacteroidales bacterium]